MPDIYFTANKKGSNKLYINKGNFQFEDVTAKAGVAGTSNANVGDGTAGVLGLTDTITTKGIGVWGEALATTDTATGVYGSTSSVGGVAWRELTGLPFDGWQV